MYFTPDGGSGLILTVAIVSEIKSVHAPKKNMSVDNCNGLDWSCQVLKKICLLQIANHINQVFTLHSVMILLR